MSFRIPMLVALSVLFAAPAIARGQTTDEVRALAGKMLPQETPPRPVPPGTFPQTTDDARALAGRMLQRSEPAPARVIQGVGSTDEARAVAGGILVVAPAAQHEPMASCGSSCETVASCGRACNCGHHG